VGSLCAFALLVAGCTKDGSPGSGSSPGRTVKVGITDAGCDPAALVLPAGPTTFVVTNKGTSAVTEYEVKDGETIVGEKENLTPGLSGTFSIDLKPGDYTLECPGGTTSDGTLHVTGQGSAALGTDAAKAVGDYRAYLETQTDRLVTSTRAFAAAVVAGDVARAKALYPEARVPYESIEPVAESFGDLDAEIDARVDDVDPGTEWTGFHRIERALWSDGSTDGMGPVARKLVADVEQLQGLVKKVDLQPAQIANGASELLDEVSRSKITGEEDRYSHTDLSDFEANVQGSFEAFRVLQTMVARTDPSVVTEIQSRFRDVQRALGKYRTNDGGFVSYTSLGTGDLRSLAQAVDALAEPMSTIGAMVVNAGT
jgi:iron uptake system component EfeO